MTFLTIVDTAASSSASSNIASIRNPSISSTTGHGAHAAEATASAKRHDRIIAAAALP